MDDEANITDIDDLAISPSPSDEDDEAYGEPSMRIAVPVVGDMEGYLDHRASVENTSVIEVLEDLLSEELSKVTPSGLYGHPADDTAASLARIKSIAHDIRDSGHGLDWKMVRARLYVRVKPGEIQSLYKIARKSKTPTSEVAYYLISNAVRQKR